MMQYETGNYELDYLRIENYRGQFIDITAMMNTLSITEDLFSTCMYGTITLQDQVDLQQELPLMGEEKIKLRYRTYKDMDWVELEFRVYQMSNRTQISNGAFGYILSFASEEMFLNKFEILSKSYRSKLISDIVASIIKEFDTDKDVFQEKTDQKINYIQPQITPFQAINTLTQKAKSPKHKGSSYVFYESIDGFHFESIETMFEKEPVEYYMTTSGGEETQDKKFYRIVNYDFPDQFNKLDLIEKGMFGGTLRTLDLLTRSFNEIEYNYDEDFEKTKHVEDADDEMKMISPNFPWKDRITKGAYKSVLSTDRDIQYIKTNSTNFDREWQTKERSVLWRMSQLQQITNNLKIRLQVPGNSELTAGTVLDIKLPSMSTFDFEDEVISKEDRFVSGKYLALTVNHTFSQTKMFTIVEAAKDCFKQSHEDELREKLFR